MPPFSQSVLSMPASPTIAMATQARRLRAEGKPVISLALGEPDFATPQRAIDAAYEGAKRGETKYPPADGMVALKEAVQKKFHHDNQLDYALNEIMVANGGKQLIFNAFMATLAPGDEVVIPTPYWVGYPLVVQLLGGKSVYVPCREEDQFSLSAQALAEKMSERTRWAVLNFPNNPTGAVCSKEEMLAIAEILRRYPQCWIMCDEIYEHLIYDGVRHYALAALAPDLKDRILTINGVSKAFAMTGWRIGFAGGSKDLIQAMVKIQGNSTSGASTISQIAATAALEGGYQLIQPMVEAYDKRRNLVVDLLKQMPGLSCALPSGAFYAYPGIQACIGKKTRHGRVISSDTDFASALLEEEYVATVQGAAFGASPYIRLSYATDEKNLQEACARIKYFVEGLS